MSEPDSNEFIIDNTTALPEELDNALQTKYKITKSIFSFQSIEEFWPFLMQILDVGMHKMPIINSTKLVCIADLLSLEENYRHQYGSFDGPKSKNN
jgi:hypothetical protein